METASLHFSLLDHGSYCKTEEATDDTEYPSVITTYGVNIHFTCDPGETDLNN